MCLSSNKLILWITELYRSHDISRDIFIYSFSFFYAIRNFIYFPSKEFYFRSTKKSFQKKKFSYDIGLIFIQTYR